MSDLERYVKKRKRLDPKFAEGFEVGYSNFKVGVLLRQAREKAGMTQDDAGHARSKFTIEEGYQFLRKLPRDNLGWRIVMFHSPLEHEEMERIIRETYENNINLAELLPADYMAYHLEQAEKPADEEQPVLAKVSRPKG